MARTLFLSLLAGAAMMSCGMTAAAQGKPAPPPPADRAVDERVEALLKRMTPAEKAGQLFMFTSFAPPPGIDPEVEKAIVEGRAGGFFLANDPARVNALQSLAVRRSRLGIPLLFGLDALHGMRTIFPVPIGLAASWDVALAEQVQADIAREARAGGIGLVFGPNLDIARDPRWGRMVEGVGEDPFLASAMARAQVRGMQGPYIGAPDHVLASAKHFAGYGASIGGRDYDEVDLSDNLLWNVYLPPFKAAVDAGVGAIMSAYMPLNGVPPAANRWLLTDVLRGQWKFPGFVVTDAVAVSSLVVQHAAVDKADAARRAIAAGVTMELGLPDGAMGMTGPEAPGGSAFANLPAAVAAGTVPAAALDDAVRKILAIKMRLGLFDRPYADPAAFARIVADPATRALSRRAAEKSAVLLRNDANLLPLDPARLGSLAIVGPLADSSIDTEGPWVFKPAPGGTTILEGLRRALGSRVRIDHEAGVRMPPRLNRRLIDPPPAPQPPFDEDAGIARAVAAARRADATIVVVGEALDMIGENASRSTLDLPGRQQQLLDAVVATGKPTVVLVMSGRPLDLKATKAGAIMMIWYPGSEGGPAIANLLTGKASPGGKLPFSWPRSIGQVPLIASPLPSHDPEGVNRRYWDAEGGPLYPFGFGLGYSTFGYADLKVSASVAIGQPVLVSANVRNSGARAADQVVQLYVRQRTGAARPLRELKGFQRISLKPGETRSVTFSIAPQDRRYWSADTRDWVDGTGPFDVWLGTPADAELHGSFEVAQGPPPR